MGSHGHATLSVGGSVLAVPVGTWWLAQAIACEMPLSLCAAAVPPLRLPEGSDMGGLMLNCPIHVDSRGAKSAAGWEVRC